MADAHRDLLLPRGWNIGAEFRLTAGVRRRHGTLRANTHGFVHRIYAGPPCGPHRLHPLREFQVWFDATAVHRITGFYVDQEWTALQFCPAPDRPWEKVWTNVRRRKHWWAEIVNN